MDKINSLSGKKVVKNAFYNSIAWIITVVIGILATPYIVHKLDLQGYGIYALFTSFVGYYGLLDLGFGQGTTKFVAQYNAVGDYQNITRSINAALWVQLVTGIIGSSFILLFSEGILQLLKVPEIHWLDAKFGLYASAIGFFFTMITGTLSSALMGLQRYDLTSRTTLITNTLLTLSIIGILYAGYGLRAVLYVNALFAVIVCLVYYFFIKFLLPSWSPFRQFDFVYFREMFHFSSYMFLFKLSSVLDNHLVRFIISAVLNPAAVTLYVVPMKVIAAVGGLLGNITTVLFPFASELNAGKNKERLHKIYIDSTKYVSTLAFPLYMILVFFSTDILTVWMGKNFADQGGVVMSVLAIAYLITSLTMVPVNIAIGLGASKVVAAFSILVIFLNICFVYPFSLWWGITGTATAILLEQIEAPIFIIYITRKVIGVRLHEYLKRGLSFHILGASVIAGFFMIAKVCVNTNNLLTLLVLSVVTAIMYYGASILFGWIPLRQLAGLIFRKQVIPS